MTAKSLLAEQLQFNALGILFFPITSSSMDLSTLRGGIEFKCIGH
jgi:hypothetical protein